MKKHKKERVICLLIFVIIVFSGCSISKDTSKEDSITASTSSTPEIAAQNTLSSSKPSQSAVQSNTFNNKYWEKIKEYSRDIGKDFFEIGEERGVHYEWNGDNVQSAYSIDNIIYFFPELVWDYSTCSAVAVKGDYIISDDMRGFDSKVIETFLGTGYSYYAAVDEGTGYYEYNLDDFKVLISEPPEGGTAPTDIYVLIELKNETVGLSEILHNYNAPTAIIEPQQRETMKWDEISEYIDKIGKDKSEILSNEVSWVYETDSNFYKNPNGNDGYSFDETGKCYAVCVPMKILMYAQNYEMITMKEIAEHFNLPFVWFVYEGADYKYSFEDIVIFIPSDDCGQINEDSFITIQTQ